MSSPVSTWLIAAGRARLAAIAVAEETPSAAAVAANTIATAATRASRRLEERVALPADRRATQDRAEHERAPRSP